MCGESLDVKGSLLYSMWGLSDMGPERANFWVGVEMVPFSLRRICMKDGGPMS